MDDNLGNKILDTTLNISNKIVNTADKGFDTVSNVISITFKDQASDLLKFLFERDIIKASIGLILGTQITNITKTLVESIIAPIFDKLILNKNKKFEDITFDVLGIKFKVGKLIQEFIKLLLIIILVYLLWKGLNIKNFDFVKEIVVIEKPIIKK
jgi:large-conductance mechanosensitive channel